MFFIVRSFLIPFGAPRWVGAPVPAHLRGPPSASLQTLGKTSRTRGMTPYPSAASPGMALPTQPRFPNHRPLCPGTGHFHLSPGNGLRLPLASSPPGQLPAAPTHCMTKDIFPKHKSDHALPSTAFWGSPLPSAWRKHTPQPVATHLSSKADPSHRITPCSSAHSSFISHLHAFVPLCLWGLPFPLCVGHCILS